MRPERPQRHWPLFILLALAPFLCGGAAPARTLAEFQAQAVANREAVSAARTRLEQSRQDVRIARSCLLYTSPSPRDKF